MAPPGIYVLLGEEARSDPDASVLITWHITGMGFRVGLPMRPLALVGKHAGEFVGAPLSWHSLGTDDLSSWGVYHGILDASRKALSLPEHALKAAQGHRRRGPRSP